MTSEVIEALRIACFDYCVFFAIQKRARFEY